MLKRVLVVVGYLFMSAAMAAPATDESINQLMEVAHTRAILDASMGHMDEIMRGGVQNMLKGANFPPEKQNEVEQMMNDFIPKAVASIKAELTWEKLQPEYLQIYRETYTQEEVDGLIAFYQTPVGSSVINKMPLVAQKSMAVTQAHMLPLMQNIMRGMQESARRIAEQNKAQQGG